MKHIYYIASIIFITVGFYSCSNNLYKTTEQKDIYLADPTIFLDKGIYYLYGTSHQEGFMAYVSKDLKNWNYKGLALKKGDSYGNQGFWAPQVFHYNNKYYMAYTANENIAIAEAENPLGPFKQKALRNIESDVKIIDPFVFFDNGKIYLYHVRLQEGNRIFVAEMNEHLTEIIPSTLKECIAAADVWENTKNVEWPVAEGPSVFKKDRKYYMVYSANDFRNPDYAVGLAVADNPIGPWRKYTQNPFLSTQNIKVHGTGHGEVFIDKKGKYQYVFHTHFSDTEVSPRRTAVIELDINQLPERIGVFTQTFKFIKSNSYD